MKHSDHDFTLPPFPAFPSVSRYVALGPIAETVHRVSRSVLGREAISLVIGPPGTGKSLACGLLAKQFHETHDVVVLGDTAINDEATFHRFVLHRLGVPVEGCKRDELELKLHERLCGDQAAPAGALLIVDEAASLPVEILESIRRLTNVMRHDQPAVSAVVVGGAKLDETLTSPALEPFVQRVATRCYLHPLTGEETRQYIRDAIHACDASPDETITEGAVSAIFHASSGVPRLINQLMTESIDCAAERDQSLIDEAIVDQAWANLQQLPGPITDEPVLQAHPGEHSVVEFGELQDPLPAPMLNRTGEQAQKATANSDSLPAPIEDAPELSVETTSTDELTGQTDAASPALQQPPVTTDPETLFGDFDQEEAIAVGAENHRAARPPACDHDLESTIHSQIVSLSHFAAEHTEFRTDAADGLVAGNGRPVATDLPLPTAPIAEEPLELAPEAATPAEPEETFPSVVWYDENQLAEEATELPRDDSDLLWVTEDIDVDRRVGDNTSRVLPHRVDGPDDPESPKLSVDYREMLEKMRNSHG